MKRFIKVACIQLAASSDWQKNWAALETVLHRTVMQKPDVIVLPENFIVRTTEKMLRQVVRPAVKQVLSGLKKFSKKYGITIIAGSVPEVLPGTKKHANTCFVFSPAGKTILRYRKMHLFDVNLPKVKVQESNVLKPGTKSGYFKLGSLKAGVGICYDLRFPEYFRLLSQKGAEVIFIPANFTAETGKTAWEVLLRARAIENQCYVVAAGQCGRHQGSGILSYGNSMIIDSLGRVIKRAGMSRPQVLMATLDLAVLRKGRQRLPALKHRKIRTF